MDEFFAGRGLLIAGTVFLSPREALEAVGRGALLVDLREPYELAMKKFDLPEVLHLPHSALCDKWASLPTDRPLVLADSVGMRSKAAARLLRDRGLPQLASLNGGMLDWDRDGLPTRTDPAEQWTGSCACQLKPRRARMR
jgi:rhodanese-related sulfurtransferase